MKEYKKIKKSKSRVERALALSCSTIRKLLFQVKFEDDLNFEYTAVPSESLNVENWALRELVVP